MAKSVLVPDAEGSREINAGGRGQADAAAGKTSTRSRLLRTELTGPSWKYKRNPEEDSVFVVADKVFRAQVDWMVQHAGVRGDFPETMKKIWFSYLSTALPDVSNGVEDVLMREPDWTSVLREVDFSLLFDIPRQFVRPLLTALDEEQEAQHEAAGAEENEEDSRHRIYSRQKKRQGKSILARPIRGSVPERLTLPRLPALVVLGLMLCGENTMISDLLRWIRTLQFPYLSPDLTEEEWIIYRKMASSIRQIFPPLYPEIEWQLAVLSKQLRIKGSDFPMIHLAPLVGRFVEELNLPRVMVAFVMKVVETVNSAQVEIALKGVASSTEALRRSAGTEALAMSCIVYALRVVFGMDGAAEVKIGTETTKLQALLGSDATLFNFQEWVRHIDYRQLQLFRHSDLLLKSGVLAGLFLEDPGTVKKNNKVFGTLEAEAWRLQRRLREVPRDKEKLIVVLPPTHRPFRAHTEALAAKYPLLSVDFGDHEMQHLMQQKKRPKRWKVSPADVDEAERCLGRIQAAQGKAKHAAFPYRAQNYGGNNRSMDEVPSLSMRWLLTVCAEIIEQTPDSLLGQILFLELALFPKNSASGQTGKGSSRVTKMRQGV